MTGTATAIVVSYNTAEMTLHAIEGLRRFCPGSVTKVIVVDNASTDHSADAIATRFPDVTLVALDENIGFGRAVNMAADQVTTDYLVLVNPDVEIHDDFVTPLIDLAMRQPQGGLYGGRTLSEDGSVHPSSCWGLPSLWSTFCFGVGLSAAFPRNEILDPESMGRWDRGDEREVGMVTGCLLLTRLDVWRELGGFDERFFMYGEDADLSFRAHGAGYRPTITPKATITHFIGAASPKADRRVMVLRSRVTIARLHLPMPALGVGLIRLGVALRAAAHAMIHRVRPTKGDTSWVELWRRQSEWVDGY